MKSNEDQSQITVKFFTKNKRFPVPDNSFSIPTSTDSDSLSLLIKGILKQEIDNEENLNELMSAEFDFYIADIYLESNLDEFIKLNPHLINIESLIEIEYTERYPPPEPIDSILTNDWISSIKGFKNFILLGSYSNTVQLWNHKGKQLANLPGHSGAVKAVSWVSINDSAYKFVSASQDQSILVWYWNNNLKKIEKADKCIGHTESVECIDVNSEKTKFVSGSWDKTIKLWSLIDDLNDESTTKKTKSDVNVDIRTPLITLSGHTENVSSCKWMDNTNVCTGSWDHSIKLWDMFSGQEIISFKSPSKIFLSIDYSELNQLIVSGLNDSNIRIYDRRTNEGNIVKCCLSSHSGWVSSVCWSLDNSNFFVSGSYDNKAKLWDIRNSKSSVYDMLGHTDKILCVDWSMKNTVLTGSADNTFKMYKTS